MKIVIIGNGIAGNIVAETVIRLHRLGFGNAKGIAITIVADEKYSEYDPCALPYYFSNELLRKNVFRNTLQHCQNDNIEILYGQKAIHIDSQKKVIITSKNQQIAYDKLVLAYGGEHFVPPLKGLELNDGELIKRGIFGGKTLTHVEQLRKHQGKNAVVIGSGAIGVEFAVALRQRGYEVSVIEILGHILPTMFDVNASDILATALRQKSIRVLTREKVLEIAKQKNLNKVITDKREILCDTIILAAGIKVNTKLAAEAGIKTNRGILVDRLMQTNIEDIYACGDCAEAYELYSNERCLYQLKHNAIQQAKVVARNILGMQQRYFGAYNYSRIHFYDMHAASFGDTYALASKKNISHINARILERQHKNSYLRVILQDGRIIGGQGIGELANNLGVLINAMFRRDNIDELLLAQKKPAVLNVNFNWQRRQLSEVLAKLL